MSAQEYAHPRDLTDFVLERWPCDAPDPDQLQRLYATCYQASLLSEEGRSITFRALLADPDSISAEGGPPRELHRLDLAAPIDFTPRALRRLSAAADFQRTLIGVHADAHGELRIWGLIDQGARWLHDVVGGRGGGPELPHRPIVHVLAPGSLEARCGCELVGRLEGGRLTRSRFDVFDASWLHADFRTLQDALNGRHAKAREAAARRGETWAVPERELARLIGEQMVKRVVAIMRQGRHGGTLLFAPDAALDGTDAHLDIKYRFAKTPARERFSGLLGEILDTVAPLHAAAGRSSISWEDFQGLMDQQVAWLDESWYELAGLIADLASVDGAVVLNTHMDIVGFGAEISGELPAVPVVHRALDLEGDDLREEPATREGTRHRSAYRFVNTMPGALGIVVSQDGGARFVTRRAERVVYWEHE
ncbi:MAG: hypothetical protein JWM98_459 [Thermoleophilia bacterium]|nr:hypothetical protein [Thermoleophilia bacterium]